MTDLSDAVRALLPPGDWRVTGELHGSTRSRVRRVGHGGDSLIVKEFTTSDEGWVRESAALSVLPPSAPAPRLVAAGGEPPIVVMADAGAGGDVAAALLAGDPADATDAVLSWARAIADLHRTTAGLRGAFRAALDDRAGDFPVAESTVADDLDTAAGAIARHCADLGVTVPSGALDALRSLGGRLGGDGPAALTPADACPDNNVRTADGLVLIDFEGAQWRHAAWDVAYLAVPWPSCWCAWRIPADVSRRAIDTYRAASPVPGVDSPAFLDDVAVAAAGWAWVTVSWFLPRALADDAPLTKPGPRRRAMVLDRLRQVRDATALPETTELAGDLHAALVARWGYAELPYAPAFEQVLAKGAGPAECRTDHPGRGTNLFT